MQKKLGKDKTPTFADVQAGHDILSEKLSAENEALNALHAIHNFQKKLSPFKNHFNARFYPSPGEVNTEPSQTIPNQSLTIEEIYTRFAQGRTVAGVGQPEYDDDGSGKIDLDFDDFMPNLATLDLAERQQVMEMAKEELDAVKTRLDAVASARKKAAEHKKAETARMAEAIKKLEKDEQKNNGGVQS